jgi:hypothetical protein
VIDKRYIFDSLIGPKLEGRTTFREALVIDQALANLD